MERLGLAGRLFLNKMNKLFLNVWDPPNRPPRNLLGNYIISQRVIIHLIWSDIKCTAIVIRSATTCVG